MSSVIQFNFQSKMPVSQDVVSGDERIYNGLISTIYWLPQSQDILCDTQLLVDRQRKLFLLPASVHFRSGISVSAPLHLSFTLMSQDVRRVMKDTRGVLHHVHGVMGSVDTPAYKN